jgi:predicted acetyltransferase
MNRQDISLIEPTAELKDEFLAMAKEFQAEGDERFKNALEDFPAYLEHLSKYARGKNLPLKHVPSTAFWLVKYWGKAVCVITSTSSWNTRADILDTPFAHRRDARVMAR